jgi:2-amino-4-hydroxy-6-hydroxymethyldihydropteridine diphosphokinase
MLAPRMRDDAPHPGAYEHARAHVGMGSNLGDRLATLRAAADALRKGFLPHTRLLGASSIYETRPIGSSSEPYLNAVIVLGTRLAPRTMLAGLLELEALHGRVRPHPWAARSLDLDLLLYVPPGATHSLRIDGIDLRLPHPEMPHRDFVLAPLAELDRSLPVYAGHDAGTLLDALPTAQRTILHRLDAPLLDARL